MPKKRFNAEQIVTLLRQIEVAMGQGKSTQIACRDAGISEQSFRDELLNGEIFYTLQEAQVMIERWRHHYNHIRPHTSLGYKPPAPLARMKDGAFARAQATAPSFIPPKTNLKAGLHFGG